MGLDPESGVIACDSPSLKRVETYAQFAYKWAKVPITDPPCTYTVFVGIAGEYRIAMVDLGVPPGRAELVYMGAHPFIKILGEQEPQDLTMACAHACALWVMDRKGETWPEAMLSAVALAIALPHAAFLAACEDMSDRDVAGSFDVRESVVLERRRMLRAAHGSGERKAIPGPVRS